MSEPKLYHGWVKTCVEAAYKVRQKIVEQVLKDFLVQGQGREESDEHTESVVKALKSGEFELCGIVPNITYLRVDGKERDREAVFVHAFGTPAVVYKHRKTGTLVMIHPGLRLNDSELRKIDFNRLQGLYQGTVEGFTG